MKVVKVCQMEIDVDNESTPTIVSISNGNYKGNVPHPSYDGRPGGVRFNQELAYIMEDELYVQGFDPDGRACEITIPLQTLISAIQIYAAHKDKVPAKS